MINEIYEELIYPYNIRRILKTDEEFIKWLESGTNDDLYCTLKVFEHHEMYEDCTIIKNIIINNLVKMQGTNKNGISNSDTH